MPAQWVLHGAIEHCPALVNRRLGNPALNVIGEPWQMKGQHLHELNEGDVLRVRVSIGTLWRDVDDLEFA